MLVVVGGHSRNIGKTSVVAGLIRALPERSWNAMKITQFGHGVCSAAGKLCACCIEAHHPFAISEERDPASRTDTARFLAAGASRSWWVRTAAGRLGNAVAPLRKILDTAENTIVESNSLLEFFKPDLYLVVLDFATGDFKESSLRYLDRADAVIVIDNGAQASGWNGVASNLWAGKPRFMVKPPQYVPPAITRFVDERLSSPVISSGLRSD